MDDRTPFRPTRLLRHLVSHGVDFVVIGGIAMVAHGSSRLTNDLDISYALDEANLDVLGAALVELQARLRGVEDDVPFVPDGRTLSQVELLTLDTPHGAIDLLARPPGARPYDRLRRDAVRIEIDGVAVLIVALHDLEAMKLAAGRGKDRLDLEEIEAIRELRGS